MKELLLPASLYFQSLTWTLLTKENCGLQSPSFSIKLRIYDFENDKQ